MANKEKKPHLGRGLESLLGPAASALTTSPSAPTEEVPSFPADAQVQASAAELEISKLVPNPYQPRSTWDPKDLEDLASSIRANGVIQPILVRKLAAGYQIIAGERRYRAAQQAGLERVPVIVRDATDEQMLELALVENIHRADLNPIERALAYRNYLDTFNISQTAASERLGEDRTVISNHLRLLDLPAEVKEMLTSNRLSMGHARAILALPTDELRRKFANRAMAGRLSVREVERLVRLTMEAKHEGKQPADRDPNIVDLEQRLQEVLGTRVQIQERKRGGRGRILIDFYSLDEFDRLARRMGLEEVERA